MCTKLLLAALLATVASLACRADIVCLKDGTEVDGTVIEENNSTVVVKRPNGAVQSFRKSDVDVIVYDKKAAKAAEPAPAPAPAPKKAEAAPKTEEAGKKEEAGQKEEAGKKEETGKKEEAGKKEETTKPTEAAPAKEGAVPAKTPDAAAAGTEAKPKEGAVPAKTPDAAAAGTEAKPKEGAAGKEDNAKKPAETAGAPGKKEEGKPEEAKKDGGKKEEGKETAQAKDEKKEEWTPPPGLAGFPDHAKRMAKDKEATFMAALERMAAQDDAARQAAQNDAAALGPGVMPYLVAGCYHTSVTARSSCMYLVGRLNGRNAIKQAIEVFYSAIPAEGEPASFQGPFLEAIKTALPAITGQDFFTADPRRPIVQEFMKRYIAWYNDNYDRLAPQLGDPEIEATDPDYMKKLKEARALKLEKKSWPRPPMPTDMVDGVKPGINRVEPTAKQLVRPADRAFQQTIPTVKNEDVGKRR